MTLERIEHKVFASEAPLDEMGQFGSALATTKLNTKDVAEIQALPAYTKGWGSAIISENNYPAMEEMNGVLNVMSYHTGYLYQEGIPTYSATQEYSVTSWVKDLAGEKIYKSLQGGNKGHDLTDPTWWMELKLGGGGLEIGDIGIAPLGIDETKGKRRYLNGQLIIQDQYVQFTNKVKSAVALYPSLACTESEWQTTATMSVGGQVGKFVVDDEAGTIRLPKIIMPIQGLTDLSKLAEIVEAGLPNIEQTNTGLNGVTRYKTAGQINGFVKATGYDDGYSLQTNIDSTYTRVYQYDIDASRSNPIYGNSDTVQPEQIQYPYFIQVATGAETEDNIINKIELNNPYSFGDSKYSPKPLNNLSWLKSEGQYNPKVAHSAYYDWALTNANNGVKGFALSTGEYTDYDVVINTADETFRLPLLDGSEDLPSDRFVDLTLNVSGSSYTAPANGWYTFAKQGSGAGEYLYISNETAGTLRFNNSIYGGGGYVEGFMPVTKNDNVVISYNLTGDTGLFRFIYAQGNGSLYFYVGETVQNANLINAGRIEEKIASLIPDNSSLISGYAMPSNKYIDLTLGATETQYTAPANGYFYLEKNASASGQQLSLVNKTSSNITSRTRSSSGTGSAVFIPCRKGDNVVVSYNFAGTTFFFRFIYAEGEV